MLRRVLLAIMTVTTIVVLLFAVPLGFVIGRLLNDRAVLALEHRADLAARSIDLTSPKDEPDAAEFPPGPEHFALYAPDGSLRMGELVNREQAFTADASHQLRTPIAGMRTSLEAELAFPRADRQSVISESLTDLARLEQTVTDLLALARNNRPADNVIDPFLVASEARDHWTAAFAHQGRPLTLKCTATTMGAIGQTALLRQAIDALLDNALVHGAGPTTIELRPERHSGMNTLTVAVSDQGLGFAEESDGGSATGTRSGLGLPLTRRLVQAQGGRLVISRKGPNPTVQIVLRAPVEKL